MSTCVAYLFRLLKQQQQQPTNQQTTTTTTTKQKRTVTDSIMNIVCLLHPPYSHYLIIRYKGKQGPKTSFSHVSTRTCVLLRFLLIVKPNTLEDGYRIPKNDQSLVFKKKKKNISFSATDHRCRKASVQPLAHLAETPVQSIHLSVRPAGDRTPAAETLLTGCVRCHSSVCLPRAAASG